MKYIKLNNLKTQKQIFMQCEELKKIAFDPFTEIMELNFFSSAYFRIVMSSLDVNDFIAWLSYNGSDSNLYTLNYEPLNFDENVE